MQGIGQSQEETNFGIRPSPSDLGLWVYRGMISVIHQCHGIFEKNPVWRLRGIGNGYLLSSLLKLVYFVLKGLLYSIAYSRGNTVLLSNKIPIPRDYRTYLPCFPMPYAIPCMGIMQLLQTRGTFLHRSISWKHSRLLSRKRNDSFSTTRSIPSAWSSPSPNPDSKHDGQDIATAAVTKTTPPWGDKNKTSIVKKRIPITDEEDQGKSCSTVECGDVRSYTDRCYPYFSRSNGDSVLHSNGDSAMSKKKNSIPAWTQEEEYTLSAPPPQLEKSVARTDDDNGPAFDDGSSEG